jgi:V/A-type H+/Na+-transporting ATPase subunit I
MAIDALKRVTIVSPKDSTRRLVKTINGLGIMEIIDTKTATEEDVLLKRYEASTEETDDNLYKIDFILNLMNIFAPEQESFVKGLTPIPLVTTDKEVDSTLGVYNLEERHRYASELDEVYRRSERVINEVENELKDIEPLSDLPFDLAGYFSPKRVRLVLGTLRKKTLEGLDPTIDEWKRVAWEEVASSISDEYGGSRAVASKVKAVQEKVRVVFAFLSEDSEDVRDALASLGFEEIQLPKLRERIADRIKELKADLATYQEHVAAVAEKVRLLADGRGDGEGRRSILLLKAYWTNVRNRHLASTKGVHGKWVHMLTGYVRARDIEAFRNAIKAEFPESMIVVEDPAPDDDVPVAISSHKALRPVQLLTEMYGLPFYGGFDPTPFMQVNFYIFFGICFSDVGYGLMLALSSWYLTAKTKAFRGVNNLARMLLYGGISSIIFGALTGSWFGDLAKPEYLGNGNVLLFLQQKFLVIDPMDKTILALMIALGLGVLNQFFGIGLKMYGAFRTRDWMAVFSDGVCWIVTLVGLLLMVGKIFGDIPQNMYRTGLWLFGAGAIGLILTQGREAKNFVGKMAGGVVSLYGIMGSYGITAFIGDTLSYCRLLALGLTTSIVAMAFNLMAGMLRDIPYVGMILFVLILVVGHLFNFMISALGAFVHSMRLIFVEFFGRFYEGGARPFQPLGFDSSMCVMKKTGKGL